MVDPQPRTFAQTPAAAEIAPPRAPTAAGLLPPPPPSSRVRLPGGGVLSQLPGSGDLLALTVDDGTNSEVVAAYTQFAKDTGIRLTFFVNGRTTPGPTTWQRCARWSIPDRSNSATTPGRIPT